MEWVEVMDTNQSGVIDYEEFYKFFSNLDELPLNDNQIASMFREFDTSNDQEISVEEFATAMVNACEIFTKEGEIQDDNIYRDVDSDVDGDVEEEKEIWSKNNEVTIVKYL